MVRKQEGNYSIKGKVELIQSITYINQGVQVSSCIGVFHITNTGPAVMDYTQYQEWKECHLE
jgi:hypothetical protein